MISFYKIYCTKKGLTSESSIKDWVKIIVLSLDFNGFPKKLSADVHTQPPQLPIAHFIVGKAITKIRKDKF